MNAHPPVASPASAPTTAAGAEPFLRPFDRVERAASARRGPAWLFPLRKAGLARFAELGLPTLAQEDWRFTNLAPLTELPFQPRLEPGTHVLREEELAGRPFANLAGDRLVFVDGHYQAGLSRRTPSAAGTLVSPLTEALAAHPALIEPHLTRYTRTDGGPFTALNDAYFTDGAFIQIPTGKIIEAPIHLVFLSTGQPAGAAVHARNLILVGAGAQVTVIEHYFGRSEATGMTNAVTELVAGDGSVIEHVRFQDEPRTMFHLGALHARFGRAANALLHSFALGGRLSRQNIRTMLDGEGLEVILNGLYLTDGEQLADHHMVVDHAKPNGASHEYFNGILEGRSRGVFHGRILVRKGAQKTDAKQTNKNLLLSDEATANTKPQLEIYADDVKCTHGATIGQLHPEHIFYLRSRGIPEERARRMLIHAFAGEIIERVRHPAIRDELDQLVWDRLEQDTQIQVGPHH